MMKDEVLSSGVGFIYRWPPLFKQRMYPYNQDLST